MRINTMSKQDRALWRETRTLRDMGRLTALWLEGTIASQPGYTPNYGPDPETGELVPVLAQANRAGYLTEASQPGTPARPGYDDATWTQRAAVEGWIDSRSADALVAAAQGADLIVIAHPVARLFTRRSAAWIDVTRRDGRVVTGFASQRSRRDVKFQYSACGGAAVDAVLNAVQITIAAPDYGVDHSLWDLLTAWATERTWR